VTAGRDVRQKDLIMRPAPVGGGLEPQLLTESRQSVLAALAERAAAYTPEWTDRGTDAGMALARVSVTLLITAHRRLNRIPRRLALNYLQAAGVRALPASPARAVGAIEIADDADVPVGVPEGTVFTTQAGPTGPVLETGHACTALAGRIAAVAVLSGGWLALDRGDKLGGLQPFGAHPKPPAELWLGIDSSAGPRGTLSLAVELVQPLGRPHASSVAGQQPSSHPLLRWEAIGSAGPVELAVEFDDTNGLDGPGVLAFRVPGDLSWPPSVRPGQTSATPLRWLRARLVTSFRSEIRLERVLLNGVNALAARSVRDEVAEPLERQPAGGSTYRLSQAPVIPGSVTLDITEPGAGLAGEDTVERWQETISLAAAQPDDRVFLLDPAAATLSFGDGVHGRAVPEGYRNVVARRYRTAPEDGSPPAPADLLPPERSVPDLTGLRVASISTGSPAEQPPGLLQRGPGEIRSRLRAVAATDYAVAALTTPGIDVARAYSLPGLDPAAGGPSAGTVGVVVVPRSSDPNRPPRPTTEALKIVADHLAKTTGVVGARVVSVAPSYRQVAVEGLLVGAAGADLAAVVSSTRQRIDRWLDPLVGGDGSGWEFGAPVRWNALVRTLLTSVADLQAASQLSFRVDGRRLPRCADVLLAPGELTWPGNHLLEAIQAGSPP
jgi:predicted phage baseplate assembly protein